MSAKGNSDSMKKLPPCPKCGDWRVEHLNPGSDFEECHCLSCGLIVNIALLKGRRTIEHREVDQNEPVT